MDIFKIDLLSKATDNVSGFSGTVIGRAQYSSGCIQYAVVPKASKDGSFIEAIWFDEDRLLKSNKNRRDVGGPPHTTQTKDTRK